MHIVLDLLDTAFANHIVAGDLVIDTWAFYPT